MGILARSNPSNWRAIALLNAFEFFAFEARFGFPPLQAVLLLGYLHPLLPALWKSPARKYRRRRGNGGTQKKSTYEFRALAESQEQEWRIQEEKKLRTTKTKKKN